MEVDNLNSQLQIYINYYFSLKLVVFFFYLFLFIVFEVVNYINYYQLLDMIQMIRMTISKFSFLPLNFRD